MFADSPSIETDPDIFTNAARVIYDAGRFDASMIADPAIRAQIEQTFNAINTAIDEGIGYDVPAVLRYALENNAFIFSGFKTYHSMRELGLSLLTDKGDIKPFNKFLDDALAINAVYNKNYLFAEYKHAVAASQMALRWHEFQKDGDRYNLQYRTAADSRVREEHALLHNTTLPIDDPFWDSFFPPNGWGCRCTAVQVRKSKYPLSNRDLAMKRGNNCTDGVKKKIFRYNPGKSLQLFPPKHPYYKVPNADKKVVEKFTAEQLREKRINEMIAEMPDNLSAETKKAIAEHNLEVEKALGITKGKPMTVEEADKQNANPNYGKSKGYGINCQTCTPAYLLRSRGFNITAKENTSGSKLDYLSRGYNAWEIWRNPDGSKATHSSVNDWLTRKKHKLMTKKRWLEYFNETCKEEGIYALCIGWKGGGGHMTILQRFKDGELRYIEPQHDNSKGSGRENRDINYLAGAAKSSQHGCRGIMRIDDKLFDTQFIEIFNK